MKYLFWIVFFIYSISAIAQDSSFNLRTKYPAFFTAKTSFRCSQRVIDQLKEEYSILMDFHISTFIPFKSGLLIPENGSGRIYYADSTGRITRIDQTPYGGDRFGALTFVYNDTLFSIGGYGFWRVNGAIRYFNMNTREWNIIKTEKNIPVANGVNAQFLYHPTLKKVFVIYKEYRDEYLKNDIEIKKDHQVYFQVFDLTTKSWTKETYELNKRIANHFQDIAFITTTNSSFFINSRTSSKTLELNVEQNACYEIDDFVNTEWIELNQKYSESFTLLKKDSLCIYDLKSNELKSISTKSLNRKLVSSVFEKSNNNSILWNTKNGFIALLILNIILLIFCIKFYKKNNKQIVSPQSEEPKLFIENDLLSKVKSFVDLLDEQETKVVAILSKNYKEGKLTSIDEINKLIGVDKRPYKIRNNMRADVLKLINKKFMDFSSTSDELIIRERSEFDKRYFEYTLNDRYASKIG